MSCATQLAGILWNIDAYVLWAFLGVGIALFIVWGLTVMYYHLRYGDQIRAESLFDTGLHGEPEPRCWKQWLRSWSAGR